MKPILPRPVRSIIERQRVVLSRCVFAIGLPGNGILPELDDRQILTIRLQIVCATTGEESHASPTASFLFSVFSFQKGQLQSDSCSAIWRQRQVVVRQRTPVSYLEHKSEPILWTIDSIPW